MSRIYQLSIVAAVAVLGLSSCGRQTDANRTDAGQSAANQSGANQSGAINGSNIVVGDEKPANGTNAATPVSGSGEVPSNAGHMNPANGSENNHAAE